MIRLLLAAVVGVGVGGAVAHALTHDPRYIAYWTVALPVGVICAVLVGIGGSLRGLAGPPQEQLDAARTAGRLTAARIDSITQTGTQINDVPVCEIHLTVEARDRGNYRTTVRRLVPMIEAPQFQPGTALSVVRLREDEPAVAIVPDGLPHLHERVARLPKASGVPVWAGETTSGPRSIISTGRKGRGRRWLAYAAFALAGLAVVAVPARTELALSAGALVSGDDRDSYLYSEDRVADAVAELREVTGDDAATEVLFYDDMVRATAPSEPGATTYDDYTIRYGRGSHDGPSTIQPDDTASFTLDEVSWAAIPSLARRAAQETGVTGEDPHVHADVSRALTPSDDGSSPVRISIYVSGDYGSGALIADADGTVIEVRRAN
ncbi:hypothetical protein JL108_07730 [Aeromicrobium sp. YIM 150415]|uniref:hypothetical protein n=1 Tax=Aeromicrobium sp. YIM 150415 TaxID=2803912 RepID=UPI00196560CD|nr:hypothetical protein [Aeromicrobium sp. YIM 150415]MBM9463335.1 hypothetical protein [Aeromicrobium sp. YIM 150415]